MQKNIITDIDEKIAPFEKVAREKNDELKEYKRGYEYSRNKALIDGIIETIIFIENAENKINSSDEIEGKSALNRALEFSLLLTIPSAIALSAVNCACISVGKAG